MKRHETGLQPWERALGRAEHVLPLHKENKFMSFPSYLLEQCPSPQSPQVRQLRKGSSDSSVEAKSLHIVIAIIPTGVISSYEHPDACHAWAGCSFQCYSLSVFIAPSTCALYLSPAHSPQHLHRTTASSRTFERRVTSCCDLVCYKVTPPPVCLSSPLWDVFCSSPIRYLIQDARAVEAPS